jgi:hypothetical protein
MFLICRERWSWRPSFQGQIFLRAYFTQVIRCRWRGRYRSQAVIPVQAGIQEDIAARRLTKNWIPACAGMTSKSANDECVIDVQRSVERKRWERRSFQLFQSRTPETCGKPARKRGITR